VARVEAYGDSGVVAEGVVAIEFADALTCGRRGRRRRTPDRALGGERRGDLGARLRPGDEAEALPRHRPRQRVGGVPAGVTEATVTFRTLLDGRHEGDERALAQLDGPRGGALGFQRRSVILIRDADPFDPT
jgi:hypothetical protein